MNVLMHVALNRMCSRAAEKILNKFASPDSIIISRFQEQCEFTTSIPQANRYDMMSFRKHNFSAVKGFYDYPPIDQTLLKSISYYESEIYKMMDAYYPSIDSFHERQCILNDALRLFNGMLLRNKIELFINFGIPHQIYDFIIYVLCKVKGISSLILYRTPISGYIYIMDDIDKHAPNLPVRFKDYVAECQNHGFLDVPLPAVFEQIYRKQTQSQDIATPYYMQKKNFREKLALRAVQIKQFIEYGNVFANLRNLIKNQRNKNKIDRFISSHAVQPDLNKKYIYFALQVQPEGTTSPMGGVYVNQQLSIELLANCLPYNIIIYVKEHPAQSRRGKKDIAFFQRLLDLPNVQLVPTRYNTGTLINHALAVATATGTVAFEAIFKEIPAIMFGHYIMEYGPAVFVVKTVNDCKKALEAIINNKYQIGEFYTRTFLKAINDCVFRGEYATRAEKLLTENGITEEESNTNIFNEFAKRICELQKY